MAKLLNQHMKGSNMYFALGYTVLFKIRGEHCYGRYPTNSDTTPSHALIPLHTHTCPHATNPNIHPHTLLQHFDQEVSFGFITKLLKQIKE